MNDADYPDEGVLTSLCEAILDLSAHIEFAAIASFEGEVIAAKVKPGSTPILSPENNILSIEQSLLRMNIRRTLERHLGRPIFSITEYEHARRASVTWYDKTGDARFIVVLSFDKKSDNEKEIILHRVIPLLSAITV